MVLIAIFAPLLSNTDPTALAPAKRNREPSAEFWFGTDAFGRDIYSRVLYGARASITVAALSVSVSLLVGTLLGLVAGVGALVGVV